jgi:CheY-like chemotaxis protein
LAAADGAVTVLLVDDEPDVRRLFGAMLSQRRYRVIEAATGDEGLALARRDRPKVVLLDVAMPGTDGYEICRRIKADPDLRDTAVLLVTAQADDFARDRAEQVGADAHVAKPFSPSKLLALIDQFAARPS